MLQMTDFSETSPPCQSSKAESQCQRLGDLLAEAFDRLPSPPENGDFERPPQGAHEESPSFDS